MQIEVSKSHLWVFSKTESSTFRFATRVPMSESVIRVDHGDSPD
jgi:hypothetical protein